MSSVNVFVGKVHLLSPERVCVRVCFNKRQIVELKWLILNYYNVFLVLIQCFNKCRLLIIYFYEPNVFQKTTSVDRVYLTLNVLGL